jgi:DNA-binding response OmpR family regulator
LDNANENARILIVDDTLKNIQVLGTILKEANYQINVAQDGQQALASVEKVVPDLILLDIMMPVMDGFETCTHLKANPATADIPIVFLTAKTEAEDIVKGFELGAVDYVTKPFNAAELFVRVESHLTRRRLQREVEQQLHEIASLKEEQEFFVTRELGNRVELLKGALEQQSLEQIGEGIQSLDELVRMIKGLSDFGKGEYQVNKEEVQLDQLLRQVVGDLEMTFGTLANVLYQNQLANPVAPADRDLLRGVFHDLIKKAIEQASHHPDTADRAVRVSLLENDTHILIEVHHKQSEGGQDNLAALFDEAAAVSDQDANEGGSALLVARAHGGSFELTVDGETTNAAFAIAKP